MMKKKETSLEFLATTEEEVSSDEEIDYSVKSKFYDPHLDDRDELWVNTKRRGHISDAVLSCPACFTTLCVDCQRHEKYLTQYRAMFVMNCKIRSDQLLREAKRRRNHKQQAVRDSDTLRKGAECVKDEVTFKPVCCSICSTEVAVFDEDEVYHFFNVLASES